MKPRKGAVLLVATLCLLALALMATMLHAHRDGKVNTPLSLDWEDSGRGGGWALFLLSRSRWPDCRLENYGKELGSTTAVLSLAECPPEELERVLQWVQRGGRALLLVFHEEPVLKKWGMEYSPTLQQEGRPSRGALKHQGQERPWVEQAWGRGQLVVLADPWIFSNDGLDQGENAALAWKLIAGQATFLKAPRNVAGLELLVQTPWTRASFVLFGLGALLFVWNENVPTLRLRSFRLPRERSLLEFVESAAWLYQKGKATRLVLDSVYQGAGVRLSRRLGRQRFQKVSELVTSAFPEGTPREELSALCERIEAALLAERPPGEGVTLALVQQFQSKMKACEPDQI